MKKILLINPGQYSKKQFFDFIEFANFPPLNLTILAAYTPESYEVKIVDEQKEKVDFDSPVDLVGITAMTVQAPRAYAISAEFRRRGVPVVMGGIHASFLPNEALRYVDSVVVGEADDIWTEVLADFERQKLKKKYIVDGHPNIVNVPMPRRELLSGKYLFQTLQTTRGCPNRCYFCSVTHFNGVKHRMRSIDNVMEEIAGIKQKRLMFLDDNIIGTGRQCMQRAMLLFERLKEHNKIWFSQCGINIAEDDKLLKAAYDAGGRVLLIGFESVQPDALRMMNKNINLHARKTKSYKDVIRKIQDHGISIIGGFILGTDQDTLESSKRMIDFVQDSGIDCAQFTISTPLPGTDLYFQLQREGRLLYTNYPEDWQRYNVLDCVFEPKNMSSEEIHAQQVLAYKSTSSLHRSLGRGVKTLLNTRSLFAGFGAFSWAYGGYKYATQEENVSRDARPVYREVISEVSGDISAKN